MASTVMDVFRKTTDQYATKPAIRYKVGSEWQTKTWTEYWNEVHCLAAALADLGLEAGDFTAILSTNCPECCGWSEPDERRSRAWHPLAQAACPCGSVRKLRP